MDGNEDLRRAMREMLDELQKAADQAGRMLRQAAEDAAQWVRPAGGEAPPAPPPPPAAASGPSPFDLIRDLGRLRDEGHITEAEYEAKKRELLEKI
jgi:hypothetical protein